MSSVAQERRGDYCAFSRPNIRSLISSHSHLTRFTATSWLSYGNVRLEFALVRSSLLTMFDVHPGKLVAKLRVSTAQDLGIAVQGALWDSSPDDIKPLARRSVTARSRRLAQSSTTRKEAAEKCRGS